VENSGSLVDFYTEMHPMNIDEHSTTPTIHVWCNKFAHGRESVADEE